MSNFYISRTFKDAPNALQNFKFVEDNGYSEIDGGSARPPPHPPALGKSFAKRLGKGRGKPGLLAYLSSVYFMNYLLLFQEFYVTLYPYVVWDVFAFFIAVRSIHQKKSNVL